MNASGKQPQRFVGRPPGRPADNLAASLADTEMAASSGAAFERTELGGKEPVAGAGAGTLTDAPSPGGKGRPRTVDEIERNARYEIQGEHARGGLGRVLKARDTHLGRTVAIKELLEANPFAESLFVRESLITGRLQHPGIVPVHEAGRWPSGDPYYVMKLLSGESLQSLIRKQRSLAERMALLPHVLDVVETIAYAHSQGIIHRDIKPANVVVGEFGETVVVDWGLARDDREPVPPVRVLAGGVAAAARFEPSSDRGSRAPGDGPDWQISGNYSVSGKVVGTPAYMSPEQARGDEVDERTDVYALGALMYEVLAGRPPYPGDRLQDILERVLAGPPTPLAERLAEKGDEVQPDLITIVERAMARDRGDRYPSAKELAEDLRRFQTGQLVSVHQYKTWTLVKRWIGRHRAPLAVAAVAVVVLAAFGVYSVNRVVEQKNLAQAQRLEAREARDAMAQKHTELTFLHAASALHDDPTTTLAWLTMAPLDGAHFEKALPLTEEAVAMGVARHVLEHESMPWLFVYTPDGKEVVIADMDGSVRVADVASGVERPLFARNDIYNQMAVSPDGATLAVGTSTGALLLHPLARDARPEDTRMLEAEPGEQIARIRFSADSREVSVHARNQVVHTFRVADGEHLGSVPWGGVHQALQPSLSMAVGPTPDQVMIASPTEGYRTPLRFELGAPVKLLRANGANTRVIAITEDGGLYRIDALERTVTRLGEAHHARGAERFPPLMLARSGRWLVTRMPERTTLALWDLDTGTQRLLVGHQDTVFGMVFSPDERFLVTTSDDTTVRIWDIETREEKVLRGHTDDVFRAVISPTGDTIVSSGRDRTVRIWPVPTPEGQRFPSGAGEPFSEVAFTDPDTLVMASMDGRMARRQLSTGQSEDIARSPGMLLHAAHSMSPDGRFVLMGDDERRVIELWHLADGSKRELAPLSGKILAVTWAPDSSGFVAMDTSGETRWWLTESEHSAVLPPGDGRCGAALAPTSNRVAVVSNDRIDVYDTRTLQHLASTAIQASRTCNLPQSRLQAAYAPDGQNLAVAYPQRGILIWNELDHSIREFPASSMFAHLVAFSPDSTRVATFHYDLSLHLVDLRRGTARRLGYHQDLVYELVFSPDSRTLASSSYDRTIRLWDTDGDDHRIMRGHTHGVVGVAFSPDGEHLGSVSMDGTVRLWDLDRTPARDANSLRAYIQSQTTATVVTADTGRARTPAGLH